MIPASPYRIPGERPVGIEPVASRIAPPPRAPDSEAEVETVACEYDTPQEPELFPSGPTLQGVAIGAGIVVALTALILWLTGWSPA